MSHDYLDAVYQGKNQWWRYVIAILLILFVWLFFGSIPIVLSGVALEFDSNPSTGIDLQTGTLAGIDPFWNFLLLMVSFILLFLGVFLAVTLIHRRRFITLITPGRAINWKRVIQGFGVWFGLAALLAVVESVLYAGRYQFGPDWARFIPYVLAALVLVPIQTTSEELVFRGYVLQSASLLTRNKFILIALSGLLFMLPHLGNPEVDVNFWLLSLFYFSFGAFLALVSLRDNSLELAIGVHAANNLFTALFANYQNSALETPAIFLVSVLDPVYALVSVLFAFAAFYFVFFRPRGRLAALRQS